MSVLFPMLAWAHINQERLIPAAIHLGLGSFAHDKDFDFGASEGKNIFSRTGGVTFLPDVEVLR